MRTRYIWLSLVCVCANMAWRGNSDQTSQKPLASHMSGICVAKSEAFYTVDAEIDYPYWKKIPFRKDTRLMWVWDLFVHHEYWRI